MEEWKSVALDLYGKYGRNWSYIADLMWSSYFKELNHFEAKEKIRGFIRHDIFAGRIQRGKESIKSEAEERFKNRPAEYHGDKQIVIGIVADTHINSNDTQITGLHNFYKECERLGVRSVFHCGDIDEGERMREGHAYQCYSQGADEHTDEIVRIYPKIDGITTYFITGNHDFSIFRHSGHNIGKDIALRRDDMVYLGADRAVYKITPKCTIELRHPWDGNAKAVSLKAQNIVDGMTGADKPSILAIGHYHKQVYLYYQGVQAFMAGCFEARTNFEVGKNILISTGGWIVTLNLNDDGSIHNLETKWVEIAPIFEDYKSWR